MTTTHAHDHAHDPGHAHAAGDEHGHGHDHPPYLAHHWDTPKQQFEAGKLGMWLFLATEVLLFGGLFCAYSVWRGNHPELFKYGSQFLDTKMGAINTAVLILSSLTMAWGVTCAQKSQRIGLIICLVLTLAGAATFMVIKYFEYTHKFHEGYYPGLKFYDTPSAHSSYWAEKEAEEDASKAEGAEAPAAAPPSEAAPAPAPDAAPTPNQGVVLGGETSSGGDFELSTVAVTSQAPAGTITPEGDIITPKVELSTVVPPAEPPSGLAPHAELIEEPFKFEDRHAVHGVHHPLLDTHRPPNAHMFFNIYFMMTGLHGIHVLVGMIVITWLLVGAFKGKFNADYFTPVDLGGLYWHIVDLIWIFLFPLFYLI